MASVDGARPTEKPCDTVSKVKCGPCVHSGLVKEASAYCQQCEEHMCVECASMHKGFKISRNHSIISGSDKVLPEQTGVKKLSLSYCAEHGDSAIEWFCQKDDVMFCDTCKRIKHRKCQVTSVSDKKAFGHARSLADVSKSLVSLNRRITELRSERQNSANDLEDAAYSCQLAVQQFKSTIMEKVERLEKELLSDIKKFVTADTAIIQDHVFTCDSLIPQVDDALATADEAKTFTDDVTSVIAAHKLAKVLTTLEPTVFDLAQEVYNVQIKFKPSGILAELFNGTDELGTLEVGSTERVRVAPPETASDGVPPVSDRKSWSDMEVVSTNNINVPAGEITGSAILPDGRLVLADCSNNQIILLDQTFTIQKMLGLAGKPWNVAAYGFDAAVVTMPYREQLQFIHVDTTPRTGRTIPTGECWGVAVHGSEIYVGMHGGQYGSHVQVMDTCGNVTWRIGVDVHDTRRSDYPDCITVDTGGSVYISNYSSGYIKCYTNAGDVVYNTQVWCRDTYGNSCCGNGPRGMVVDEEDNLIVCCYKSNDIHVLGNDGVSLGVILSSADVARPRSVSYRRSDQTIIATMNNNTPSCRAYKLK